MKDFEKQLAERTEAAKRAKATKAQPAPKPKKEATDVTAG